MITPREIIAVAFARADGQNPDTFPGIQYAYLFEADETLFALARAGYRIIADTTSPERK